MYKTFFLEVYANLQDIMYIKLSNLRDVYKSCVFYLKINTDSKTKPP